MVSDIVHIDFETKSTIDIKKSGAWVYSKDPSTDILCLAVKFPLEDTLLIDNVSSAEISSIKLQNYIKNGALIYAHNVFFEKAIWKNIMVARYGYVDIPPNQWRCSASVASYHALPRALGNVGKVLNLKTIKSDEGKRIMLQLSQPRVRTKKSPEVRFHTKEEYPDKFRTLYNYCITDVEAEHKIHERLGDLPPKELEIWQLDQKINERGVPIDIEAVNKILNLLEEFFTSKTEELIALTDGEITSVGQVAKMKEWCLMQGEVIEGFTKENVEQALKTIKNKKVIQLLKLRQALGKTSTAKFEAMKSSCDKEDNRIRDTLMYHGATTGRWSGKLVQFQNLPRGSVSNMEQAIGHIKSLKLSAIQFLHGDIMTFISSVIRGMVSASKNKKLLVADFASIEARGLAWLAKCNRMLTQFENGEDLYKDMASKIYKVKVENVTSEQRHLGKQAILGAGYGMGHVKFLQTCLSRGIEIDEVLAKTAINAYRNTYVEIPRLWKNEEDQAKDCVRLKTRKGDWFLEDGFLKRKLPSGRCLHYYEPRIETRKTAWGETQGLSYTSTKNGKTFKDTTYGGRLVENITQAVARDLMAEAMLRIENAGYPIIMSIHDEIVAETDKNASLKNFCDLMSETPNWAEKFPLDVEGWEGNNYRK